MLFRSEDGTHGLVVPPRDANALTDALRRFVDEPALRERLGAAAHERAHAVADHGVNMRRAEAIYYRLVERRPLPSDVLDLASMRSRA